MFLLEPIIACIGELIALIKQFFVEVPTAQTFSKVVFHDKAWPLAAKRESSYGIHENYKKN